MAEDGNKGGSQARMLVWVLAVLVAMSVYGLFLNPERTGSPEPLSYTRFKEMIVDNRVESVEFRGPDISGVLAEPLMRASGEATDRFTSRLPPVEDPALVAQLTEHGVEITSRDEDGGAYSWLAALLPWVLIVGFWYFVWTRLSGFGLGGLGRKGLGGALRSRARRVEPQAVPKVRFDDVAGQDSAKSEVSELLEFLRSPERYRRLGAEVPHGILLQGPPGTGKTMLARALAGEAQVPFFHISASEFIEVFVGVGASRVRHLFEDAKKAAPSIIFIDEIDSVGRVRGAGFGGGHDEREQTLNQILAEMDGFEGHEAVVVLAATNRPDVLDPALLRPGRFDRHVTLELPDLAARAAILRVHTRNVPLADDVDLETVAAGTPGFSGADLKNLVNEAAMAAAREELSRVSARHFDDMRDRIIMGSLRTMAIHPDERHRLAVHEAGHTAVAYFLPEADPIHKVTIIPRGRALGGTHQLPEVERHTFPESYLQDRLAVVLAGRASEKVFLDSVSSGADEDIRIATHLAHAMVGRWGMSEEVGPVDVRESDEHPFLGREFASPRRFSDATAKASDDAVRRILVKAEDAARSVLDEHRIQVEKLVRRLEEAETLDLPAVAECLGPRPVSLSGASHARTGQARYRPRDH